MPRTRSTNPQSDTGRYAAFAHHGSDRALSVCELEEEVLSRAIDAVTAAGDLISFGRTSDGGACVVSVIHNGQVFRQYTTTLDDLQACLRDLASSS